MLKLQKILLPVDFARSSAVLAHHARLLARPSNAEVIVLHAVRPVEMMAEGMDLPGAAVVEWYQMQRPRLEKQLEDFCRENLAGCRYRPMLREGDAAGEIIRVATEENADMVMISTHGYGIFRRFILGSVAAKVLHDCPVPVLSGVHIAEPTAHREVINRILAAIDLGPQSSRVLSAAATLAAEFSATLTVLHVLPEPGDGIERFLDASWDAETTQLARNSVDQLLAGAGIPNAQVELVRGTPSHVVRQVAFDSGTNLVIIGRQTDDTLFGRMRAQAYAIVRESPCPVLSV